jgi:hypothetical protein
VFFNDASATQARESRKSPDNTANCIANEWEGTNNVSYTTSQLRLTINIKEGTKQT